MTNQDLVWYVSYGSNLSKDRFYLYIQGGQLPGTDRMYPGCRNKSLPLAEKNITLNYELYFARKAKKTWNGGGVGFITTQRTPDGFTYCKMYLITEEQFIDVVKQESDTTDNITIDFKQAVAHGNIIFRPSAWYGNLIYLGIFDNKPGFTFTNENNRQAANKPDNSYLKEISKGLKESLQLTDEQIAVYFHSKEGVRNNFTLKEIINVIRN